MNTERLDKNGFANLFVFEKIFDCKVRKSHVRVVVDATFSLLPEVFIFLNYCYWVCKHTQKHFFCLIVPLKSVRSLQKFSESVRPVIVNNYADTMSVLSTTTVTRSPFNWTLTVVNDYADTVSA